MDLDEIRGWLMEQDPERVRSLFRRADRVRQRQKGDRVLIRGLLEISNECVRSCHYCGLRAENRSVRRYRMGEAEILAAVDEIRARGYTTVVIQAGESGRLTRDGVGRLIRRIKAGGEIAVTLSLGERDAETLAVWREQGADRYLLKFETSDAALYQGIHPPRGSHETRLPILEHLKRLGYEVGSGIMVGLPGQTLESVARDLRLFSELSLDMVAVGPYVPHPETPLGHHPSVTTGDQLSRSVELTLRVLALARLLCPRANIPATTALGTVERDGLRQGLAAGANVIMHNLTPARYKPDYQVYHSPNRSASSDAQWDRIAAAIEAAGRTPG